MVFLVVMYGCESWTTKKADSRRIDVFELESPLDGKKIKPVIPKGNQSWLFIGRTDAEAETPILWTADVKSWLIWKDPDAGKDWGQEEKGIINYSLSAPASKWRRGLFLSCPASGSFPMSQFFTSGGQRIGSSASASVLPMNIQDWFPLGMTGLISWLY